MITSISKTSPVLIEVALLAHKEIIFCGDPFLRQALAAGVGFRELESLGYEIKEQRRDRRGRFASGGSTTIRGDEVVKWQKGSKLKGVMYHSASPEVIARIKARGVDVKKGSPYGVYGQGFYTAKVADVDYGGSQVKLAIRMERPLKLRGTARGRPALEEALGIEVHPPGTNLPGASGVDISRILIQKGYDGVLIDVGPGQTWAVVLKNESVRVVSD